MGVSRVEYYGKPLIDISDSTVTESTLLEGVTAYNKRGELIHGTIKPPNTYFVTKNGTIDLSSSTFVTK